MSSSLPSKLPTIEKTEIVAEKYGRKLQVDYLKLPSGDDYEYITFVSHSQSVMILTETEEGMFVLNEEYRCPVRKVLLSLPGGCVDEGEDPKDAAPRELLEETGYEAPEFFFLGRAYPAPGHHCQETFYYYAKGAKKISEPTPELCEIFETIEMSIEEINERLLEAENIDGHITTALYLKNLRDF